MGLRPRLRAAAASRLVDTRHLAHGRIINGSALAAVCCRRFVVSAFRVLQSAFRDVGVSCHAGWFHGLTPTATCCRRFAAGLSWACRTPRGWSAPDISTTAAWLAALRLPPLRSALRAVGASCSRHFAYRRFVPRFVQSAFRAVGTLLAAASFRASCSRRFVQSALRAVGASCSRHFACRRFVPRFVQSAFRTVGVSYCRRFVLSVRRCASFCCVVPGRPLIRRVGATSPDSKPP